MNFKNIFAISMILGISSFALASGGGDGGASGAAPNSAPNQSANSATLGTATVLTRKERLDKKKCEAAGKVYDLNKKSCVESAKKDSENEDIEDPQ